MGKEQILLIEPQNVLEFRGPFTSPVTSQMKLTNPSEKRVCFKIKTTAPKKYCVRPNSGILEANSLVDVTVCLQPFDYDPDEKHRHKFMVQTMIAPEGEINLDSLWQEADPDALMDSKLKCAFVTPVDPAEVMDESNIDPLKTIGGDTKKRDELVEVCLQVKRLREEESCLRQENLQLQEEILKLRRLNVNVDTMATELTRSSSSSSIIGLVLYIIMAVAIGALGYVMGKYVIV